MDHLTARRHCTNNAAAHSLPTIPNARRITSARLAAQVAKPTSLAAKSTSQATRANTQLAKSTIRPPGKTIYPIQSRNSVDTKSSSNVNRDPEWNHSQIMAMKGFDDDILFKVGVNASQYKVGGKAITRRKTNSDTMMTRDDMSVNTMTKTNGSANSVTSLQELASRYHAKVESADLHAGEIKGAIINLTYNETASMVALSMSDGRTRVLKMPDWTNIDVNGQIDETVLADEEVVFPKTSPVTTTKWCPERPNQVISGYAKGPIKYWNVDSGKCLHTIGTGKDSIASLCFNPFEHKFAASANTKICIYDEQMGKVTRILSSSSDASKMDGHSSKIFQVLYHPFQQNLLLSGGWDNTILMWDERTSKNVGRISGPHICGLSMDINMSNHLLVGSWRRESNIQIFDLTNMELLKEIDQYSQFKRRGTPYTQPYAARFLGEKHIGICGSHVPMLKIFDKKDFKITGCFVDAEASMFCMGVPKRLDYPLAVGSGDNVYFMDWYAQTMRNLVA